MLTFYVKNAIKAILVTIFMKGLKDNIWVELLVQLPKKLQEVIGRAKLIEGKNHTFLKLGYGLGMESKAQSKLIQLWVVGSPNIPLDLS